MYFRVYLLPRACSYRWLRKWPKWAIGSTSAAGSGAWHVRKSLENVNNRWYWDLSGKKGMEYLSSQIGRRHVGLLSRSWPMTSRSGQKGSLVFQARWFNHKVNVRKDKERSHFLVFVRPKRNEKLQHGWSAYYGLLQKMKSACFAGFFSGKWGLKVTRNKELLVIPHIIYIYCRSVCYCLGGWLNCIYT